MPAPIEVIILGLFSGVRPGTSTVAVVALLKSHEPRRGLLFFTVAGFVFTWSIGVLIVLALHGANVALGGSTLGSVLDIVLGAAAVGFAAGVHRGWVKPRISRSPSAQSTGKVARLMGRLRHPSVGIAAAGGALTHIPGIIYLLALNTIARQNPPAVTAGLEIAIYDVLWLLVPLASLMLVIGRPRAALHYLETGTEWVRRHQHAVLVVGFFVLGGYFVVKGTVHLLT